MGDNCKKEKKKAYVRTKSSNDYSLDQKNPTAEQASNDISKVMSKLVLLDNKIVC